MSFTERALKMEGTADLYRLIRDLARAVDEQNERLAALEAKPRPGRPVKVEKADAIT